jgi:hypothetical protein
MSRLAGLFHRVPSFPEIFRDEDASRLRAGTYLLDTIRHSIGAINEEAIRTALNMEKRDYAIP